MRKRRMKRKSLKMRERKKTMEMKMRTTKRMKTTKMKKMLMGSPRKVGKALAKSANQRQHLENYGTRQ
jgi:hypothetical protein